MANEDRRIIELPASESILNDDWIAKDSASQDTTRLQLSFLKQLCGGNNFAGEWHSGTVYNKEAYVTHEGKLYHNIKGGSVVAVDWTSSQWAQVSISNELRKIVESLASTFDTSTNYSVDDLVIYDNTLYRCIVAHTAGTWISSHFTTVKVSSLLLSSIMDNFTDIYWEDYSGSPVNYTKGTVIHKGLNLYRCKANTTNQSWDNSKWELVDVTDLLATEHGYIQSLFSIIAPTFSTSTSYNVGDFVIYNNQLYMCAYPHNGAWNSGHFLLYTVSNTLQALYRNLVDTYSFSGTYVKGDVVNYLGVLWRCIVDTATSPIVPPEWEQVTVEQLINEKVADVQIAGQTTTDENKISDLTSLAIEGTASGEIASFSDGSNLPMRSFVCNIDAVQDLHGYDGPWVGGAGKNKLNYEAWKTVEIYNGTAIWENNGVTLTATANDCYTNYSNNTYPVLARIPVSEGETITMTWETDATSERNGLVMIFPNGIPTGFVQTPAIKKNLSYTVPSGVTYISFRLGIATNGDTISYSNIMIRKSGDATFEPYENICPISGHTGVDAKVSGKNLFNLNPISFPYTYSEIAVSNNNGVIILDGTVTDTEFLFPDGINLNQTIYKYLKPSTTYVFSIGYSDDNMELQVFYRETDGASWKRLTYASHQDSLIFTTPAFYTTIWIRVRFPVSAVLNNARLYPMIRLATEQDTTYEPYNPNSQTIQVSWQTEAGEVYGGYVDLVSGELTVTHKKLILTTSMSYNYSSATGRVFLIVNDAVADSGDLTFRGYCNVFKSGLGSENNAISYVDQTTPGFAFKGDNINSVNDFIALLNNISIEVVYELTTPITYQLTPTQIKSLLGKNNAWCDTGDVDVKYNKDATIVINSLIARIEALENA